MSNPRAASLAALCAILLSGAVSAYWAFRVPIFQAPDEPAHFDYAMSIYSAHRLIRLSDGPVGWLVSPYTTYLMRASDFDRIAWHSSMRVPNGYGTRAFFAKVDAGAPRLRSPVGPAKEINYVVPGYPFGFYALEALWMHLIALFTSSVVTVFFAARLLCVFLLMVGLYFNYRTALALGLPMWPAAGLIAAVGLFPLTSFVSSYVQPDNLAYTLVSAALFYAVTLTPVPSPATISGLGGSLALLAVTKYQFFLAVAIPSVALFAIRTLDRRMLGLGLAILIVPAAGLLSVQHWYVDHTVAHTAIGHPGMSIGVVYGVLAQGWGTALRYLSLTSVGAFVECFVSGGCAATYWQVVGWFDTPIVIANAPVEASFRFVIALASIVTAVILAFFLIRNFYRILVVAGRGHRRQALDAAFGDPVLNSYLCFVGFMFGLYVATNNVFGAEGRHWYPVIFATLLCFVWYAPRALMKRHGALTAVLVAALLLYSILASGYAVAAVSNRYYGPQTAAYVAVNPGRAVTTRHAIGTLWPVVTARYHVIGLVFPATFRRGTPLLAEGVVRTIDGLVPPQEALTIDRRLFVPVLSNQYQFRLGEAAHNPYNGYSQFYAPIDTSRLSEGPHLATAFARNPRAGNFQRIEPSRLFFLSGYGEGFTPNYTRALQRWPTVGGRVELAGTCRGGTSIRAGVTSIGSDTLLLLRGQIDSRHTSRQLTAAWLLVDSRPYPTRVDEQASTFIGTLPASDLPAGAHRVNAYAIFGDPFSMARVRQTLSVSVDPKPIGKRYLADPAAACNDPLRELAGT